MEKLSVKSPKKNLMKKVTAKFKTILNFTSFNERMIIFIKYINDLFFFFAIIFFHIK